MQDLTLSELRVFEVVNHGVLQFIVCAFGIGANAVNILIFIKQGFGETVNISLFGLAISDLACVTILLWQSIVFNPLIKYDTQLVPFDYLELQYLTAGWPHQMFTRITSMITVFVTFERCLCVSVPLKVKSILTPRRTVVVIVFIYLSCLCTVSPIFYALTYRLAFNYDRNQTLYSLQYRLKGKEIEEVIFATNNVVFFGSFIAVTTCTLVLVRNLLKKQKWRKATAATQGAADRAEVGQARDTRVIKMVVFIAALYIFCYFFTSVTFALMISFDEFSIAGKYKNIYQVLWSFLELFAAINSSVNVVVYYHMSTKYRELFLKLFKCR